MGGIEGHNNNESVTDLSQKLKQNLNPELQKILADKMLDSEEAKALTEAFRLDKNLVYQVSRQNLDDLKTSLNTSKGLNVITVEDEIALDKRARDSYLKTHAVDLNNSPIVAYSTMDNTVIRSDEYNKVKSTDIYNIPKIDNGDTVLGGSDYIPGETEKKAESEFRQKYGEFTDKLAGNLLLPKGIIKAIIHEETDFGLGRIDKSKNRILNSNSGSKGIMQLTKWPFKDISGDTSRKNVVDYSKIENYRDIFKKIDFDTIMSLDMGDGNKLETTLPQDVWEKLKKLQNPSVSSEEAREILLEFKDIIKSGENKYKYFHTLNMIIGSVYFSNLYEKTSGSEEKRIKLASANYNGESGGRKKSYAKRVYNYYLEEQNVA
ncbi:MAG: hypothetical protein PHS49_06870 [Candidatus Gracilibacteria bacterium]|nr:hypothetical protein [Candidatus Gracilibacteria bacterium]